ncbi:MAG: hypothetical protein MJZ09_01335 [Bacteroidales bacterium]|nr:hypothetical protein [Bacteroidales bacterium]
MKRMKLMPLVIAMAACSCSRVETSTHDLSCQVDESAILQINEETNFNSKLCSLVEGLHNTLLGSADVRTMVCEEVNKQFDGDFDALLSSLCNNQVRIDCKSDENKVPFGELLSASIPSTKAGDGHALLNSLMDNYPDLQVSVPVHADEWDGNYIPVIAYIPENYNEGTDSFIPGLDNDGNWIAVDAIHEPDKPVIVISMNERSGLASGDFTPDTLSVFPIIEAPSNLHGTAIDEGISLTWSFTGTAMSYKIYRKGAEETAFSLIGQCLESEDRCYTDRSVTANEYYYYYVTARVLGSTISIGHGSSSSVQESSPSEIVMVQAPAVPSALSYFEAFCAGSGVELRWNNDGQTNYGIQLYYQDPAYSLDYNLITNLPATNNYYTFNSPIKGRRVVYQAFRTNTMGHSDPKYDYIYPPFRNADLPSPIYVKKISIDDLSTIEYWIRGKPEFELKVVGINSSGQTVEIQSDQYFDFDSRTNTQSFSGRNIYNWIYSGNGGWYDAITFMLVERDIEFSLTLTAKAEYAHKGVGALTYSLGGEANVVFTHRGFNCGNKSIYYYEQPNRVLSFPSGGVHMTIGESD